MPYSQSPGRNVSLAGQIAAGIAGGLIASFVMEKVQAAIEDLSSDNRSAPGGGGQQHRKPQEGEPATYKAADAVATTIAGQRIPRKWKPAAGAAVHYAFGAAVGGVYGAAAASRPEVTALAGIPFGTAVWLVADEVGVPAAGLAKGPAEYPLSKHASALAAHVVYGATIELVRRGLVLAFSRRGRRTRTRNEIRHGRALA